MFAVQDILFFNFIFLIYLPPSTKFFSQFFFSNFHNLAKKVVSVLTGAEKKAKTLFFFFDARITMTKIKIFCPGNYEMHEKSEEKSLVKP